MKKASKRKSARFSCTFKCFVSCLLSIVLITCQKNSPQYIYYECTCWFVFPLKRDFQPWSVAAVGECKRVSSYLVWYCFFLLYFIHSILFLLFLGMIFLSKKKKILSYVGLLFWIIAVVINCWRNSSNRSLELEKGVAHGIFYTLWWCKNSINWRFQRVILDHFTMGRRLALTTLTPNVDVIELSPFESAGGSSKDVQTFMNKVAELENWLKRKRWGRGEGGGHKAERRTTFTRCLRWENGVSQIGYVYSLT